MISGKKRLFPIVFILLCIPCEASFFKIEKQKLRLSVEYENLETLNEETVDTSGLKSSYLLKGYGTAGRFSIDLDVQTGLKANFVSNKETNEISPLIWSNRFSLYLNSSFQRLLFTGAIVFRNKLLSGIDESDPLIDIFGGQGFRDTSASFQTTFFATPLWRIAASLQRNQSRFTNSPASDYDSTSAGLRVTKRFKQFRWNVDFRSRKTNYRRPITVSAGFSSVFQRDTLFEVGSSAEFSAPFYISAGYFYQNNNSNNAGFDYHNHRFTFLIGTEISSRFYFQAYGILQNQTFPEKEVDPVFPFPVAVDENENQTMAASLTRILTEKTELEFGLQRLSHNSSFSQLDASKYILFAAYHYRF